MARAWIPRPVAGAQLLRLDLSAREGYVLSRIDGTTDVDELGLVTGLSSAEVQAVLERLVREGAIESLDASVAAADPPDGLPATGDVAALEPLVEPLEATHRQLFETRLHPRPEDERARLATAAEEPDLSALCFDPVPAVIHRVLENPRTGLVHARLIAAHHRNPVGLEALAARPAFLADREVQGSCCGTSRARRRWCGGFSHRGGFCRSTSAARVTTFPNTTERPRAAS